MFCRYGRKRRVAVSDSFIYGGLGDFNERKTVVSSGKKTLAIKIVTGVLLFALVCEAVIYLCIMPAQTPVKITFEHNRSFSVQELYQLLAIVPGTSWFEFDSSEATLALLTHPAIESAVVEKKFPDTVAVSITERIPVAMTLMQVGDKLESVAIDKNGVLFILPDTAGQADVPLITGLALDNVQLGMRIHGSYRPLLAQFEALQKLPQRYLSAISEIHIAEKEYGGYDLILYPMYSQIKVWTDSSLDQRDLEYMMVVLDVVNKLNENVTEIDLRYGSVSYRVR